MARRRTHQYRAEPLTHDEIRELLTCLSLTAADRRLGSLIVFLWRTGLRIEEACSLRDSHLELERGLARILHGKGDKYRVVGVDAMAVRELRAWMKFRNAVWGPLPPNPFVFCKKDGAKVPMLTMSKLFAKYRRRANLTRNITFHQLRHTFATEARREGVDIAVIQRQLGHSDLATTIRYLSQIAPQEVVDRIHQRPEPDLFKRRR